MSRHPRLPLIVTLISALLTLGSFAQAKDLANRLGIGYADQFSTSIPSLAVRYYPDPKLGVGAQLGVDTDKDNSKFGAMARLYRIIYLEDNMNFYMGTGAGIISVQDHSTTSSGFELAGFMGSEFFFSGLENLGFSFEAGIGVTSISSQVRFRTIGDTPMKAGVVFYF